MSHKRTDILQAIKTAIQAVSGVNADMVTIGAPAIEMLGANKPIISIRWTGDTGTRADGDLERVMRVVIAAIIAIDPTSKVEPLIQLGEIYDDIHAAIETLADKDINAKGEMQEDGGIEVGQEEDNGIPYTYIASMWEIKYRRQLGGV